MKLPRFIFIALGWILALASFLNPPPARASELIAVDDAGGAYPGNIATMELFDAGLYWSVLGGDCAGEFSTLPSAVVLGSRLPPFPAEHYVVRNCQPSMVGGILRDDSYVYFTTPGGVGRKVLSANQEDNHALVGLAWNALTPGAMMNYNGRAYHAYSSSSQIGGQGYFAISYFALPGIGGPFAPVTLVTHGNGLPKVGRIVRMGTMSRRLPGSLQQATWGIALGSEGYLLRFPLDPAGGTAAPATVIATDVTDFAVRREEFFDSPPRFNFFQDTLYVSVGRSRCPTDPPSRLRNLDPVSGETFTLYTSTDGYIGAIGLDAEYLFVWSSARDSLGGCKLLGNGNLRSKRLNSTLLDTGGVDPNWNAIEPNISAANLRSDGRHLYFTRGKEVRRLPNNSPPVVQDFQALGLEAVQVVQDLDNSVRLVEGKRTVVRAYAMMRVSTLAATDWFPNASLQGFVDGVELPGPLPPVNSARVTKDGDFSNLRPDITRSFQFELPPTWVRRGRLTLRFTVNPNLNTYESGLTPLANNFSEANLEVVRLPVPCVAWASMHSTTAPNYWPWENPDNFARILERAKAMLPVADIHVHPTTERVSDEHICLRTCDGPFGIPVPCGLVCNEPFDFANSNDWNEAMQEIRDFDSFDQALPGCLLTLYVGAIHPAVQNPFWGGMGWLNGRQSLAVMDSTTPLASYNMPRGGRTVAHEIGHNLSRRHVDQLDSSIGGCGGGPPDNPDTTYPFDGCHFSNPNLNALSTAMGFDMVTFQPVVPTQAGDLMSYAANRWPSTFTYNALINLLGPINSDLGAQGFVPAGGSVTPPGPYLLVRGLLDFDRAQARLKPCYTVPEGVADPAKVLQSLNEAASQPDYGCVIRKLNASGAVLGETPLVLGTIEDDAGSSFVLSQFITKPAGMTRLQILKDGVVLAECAATPNAPIVSSLLAAYDAAGPSLRIDINATDADGDALLNTVQFSNDDGATWRSLRVNAGSSDFSVPVRFLAGGTLCRVRAIVSDGFNSTVRISSAFSLSRHAPEPFIGGVRPGERLPYATTASLLGFVLDAEDGSLPAATLNWSLAGPTPKSATGAVMSLAGLSPGSYTATFTALDADNNSGQRTLSFEILPLRVAEDAAPILDGEPHDAVYTNATLVRWPLNGRATARLVHSGTNLYVALSDLAYRVGGASPAYVGVRVDVNASGNATAQTGDVGFFVDDNGIPWEMAGDGSIFQTVSSPSGGFKAVISRGSNGWNAEMRIPDSLLGGWNHAARLLLEHNYLTVDNPTVTVWPRAAGRDAPVSWALAWLGATPPAPTNRPPVARPEMPAVQSVNGLATIQLNGTASFDPDDSSLGFQWTQISGPAVMLSPAATAAPSFAYAANQATTFRFRLVVNDGQLNSQPADVQFQLVPEFAQPVTLPPATVRGPNGSLSMTLQWPGAAGDRAIVQASTDLRQWQNVATNTVGFWQSVVHTEAQTGAFPQRFYRLASAPEPPASTNLQVRTLADSGEGSLRQTLLSAPAGSTITFAPGIVGTLLLTSGELSIDRSVHIRGPGSPWLAISGNTNSRVFNVHGGTVTISGLTIRDGLALGAVNADARGGGVYNGANLALVRCELVSNRVIGGVGSSIFDAAGTAGGRGLGGGIYNTGTLSLVQCTLALNEARGGAGGRGADRDNANAGHVGGAGGGGWGGAICNAGVLGITNSTFSGNLVFGGVGGAGGEGGLFRGRGGNGGNAEGAGLYDQQSGLVMHATFTGGVCERGSGGSGVPAGSPGFAFGGALRITAGTTRLWNSIVASNSLGSSSTTANGFDVSGAVLSQGYCLIGTTNGSSGWSATDQTGNSTSPIDPRLGSLQENGGPTRTTALLPGSPAIDKGRAFGVMLDQRAWARPVDSGSHANAPGGDGSDIGALELDPSQF